MEKADELFQQALAAYKQGDLQNALMGWKKCLQEDPLYSQALFYHNEAKREQSDQKRINQLIQEGKKHFDNNKFQDSLVAWLNVLELNPNNNDAKSWRDKTREALQTAIAMNQLTEDSKEDDFFKEGLQLFRQKKFSEAAVLWDVVLTLNPKNDQARQGLNKARSSIIQEKEEKDQDKQAKINSFLQVGLDNYGAGEVLKAMESWIKILELDLDNKDALDYIVVAKADLSEADYNHLRKIVSGGDVSGQGQTSTDTIKLSPDALDETPDKLTVAEDASELPDHFEEQLTDKTTLPPDFNDEIGMVDEVATHDIEDLDDMILDEHAEKMSHQDDDFDMDDDYIEPEESDSLGSSDDDLMNEQQKPDTMLPEEELVDELDDDFDQELSEKDETTGFDHQMADDDDSILAPESIDEEEDYELDDEFIEEEEEEEALAAEFDAVVGEGGDAESLLNKYFERGMTLYQSRKYEEAIIEWKKIFDIDKNNAQAKEYIEKAITLYEASPFIDEHLAQGKSYIAEGKYEDAIAEFEKIIEIDPELNEAVRGIEKAKAKLTEVVIPARKQRKPSAKSAAPVVKEKLVPDLPVKQSFDISMLFQPKMLIIAGLAVFLVALGFGYILVLKPMQMKKADEANKLKQQETRARISQQVDDSLAAAEMSMSLSKFSEAITEYQRALSLDNNNKAAQEGLDKARLMEKIGKHLTEGDELLKNRQFDAALIAYKKALDLAPNDPKIQERVSGVGNAKLLYNETKQKVDKFIEQGDILYNEGKYKEAINMYRAGLKYLPDDADTKNAIRRAEFEQRRGTNVEANMKLGLSRYESRKYDQAKEYFKKVLELDPENQEAQFYLGKIDDESHLH